MRTITGLALLGLVFAPPAVSAQGSCKDLAKFFAKPPKIGDWADVRTDKKGDEGKKPTTMRVGFVGKENRGGEEMYRMQMIMPGRNGKQQIMQTVTPWGPEALGREFDTEIVMKMGDQPAVVMPVKADKTQKWDLRTACAKIEFVGEETVTVPAGDFQARHYKGPDGESWVSLDVPGWKIVKMVTDDGDEMVLTGTGTGFENLITETPMDMNAMMRNPEAVKRMMEADKDK